MVDVDVFIPILTMVTMAEAIIMVTVIRSKDYKSIVILPVLSYSFHQSYEGAYMMADCIQGLF